MKNAAALALLIGFALTGCVKKDCAGPCELIRKCIPQEVLDQAGAQGDIGTLRTGCEALCGKYDAKMWGCYEKSVKAEKPCEVYSWCILESYKKGEYQ